MQNDTGRWEEFGGNEREEIDRTKHTNMTVAGSRKAWTGYVWRMFMERQKTKQDEMEEADISKRKARRND